MSDEELLRLFPDSALQGAGEPPLSRVPETLRGARVFGVSELLDAIQARIEPGFSHVWVRGEVSGLTTPASGHTYFTLKDRDSQLRAVLFRLQARRLSFRLENGQEVLCLGRANIYASRGDLQLIVEDVEPVGAGALQLAFEQLKERLQRQGLFDAGHKRELPLVPNRVFVVTSPTGAAVRDFVRIARARFQGAKMVLCPVTVQGDSAPWEIISALDLIELVAMDGDVVVLTRGGGSLEDLWAFNHEGLARRIFDFPHVLVSAVGHEIDFTISDFVADVRAATPSSAAQLVFPDTRDLMDKVHGLEKRLSLLAKRSLAVAREGLRVLSARLVDPRKRLVEKRLRVDDLTARMAGAVSQRVAGARFRYKSLEQGLLRESPVAKLKLHHRDLEEWSRRLSRSMHGCVENRRSRLRSLASSLDAVSPLSVLSRGYSIACHPATRRVITSADQVVPGDHITVEPARGLIHCRVLEVETDKCERPRCRAGNGPSRRPCNNGEQ